MKRVLQVSMVDLAVALTDLVTDNPKKLNPPMLIMMRIEETAMALLWAKMDGSAVYGNEGNYWTL